MILGNGLEDLIIVMIIVMGSWRKLNLGLCKILPCMGYFVADVFAKFHDLFPDV